MGRTAQDERAQYCDKCERELDDMGHCPKHWPVEFAKLADFRRQGTVNRVVKKTSPAEDLLTVLGSPIGPVVDRLLDALAGLAISTSAAKPRTLQETRGRQQHAPIPRFASAWADTVQQQVDDRLWELTEELSAFLNRPGDPKAWPSVCDECGRKRIGEATYCPSCGERILAGSRRCRLPGCPNEMGRRVNCPRDVLHPR